MKRGGLFRDGHCLVEAVGLADTWWLRLRGLLFRPALGRGPLGALLLTPCASVHTLGMNYPLDVVFLDEGGHVLGIRERVRPLRGCAQRGARSTLELPEGAARSLGIREGECLKWLPR